MNKAPLLISAYRQHGAALLMLMIVIILIATAGLISMVDPELKKNQVDRVTNDSLAKAKEALLAYAVNSHDSGTANNFEPGRLALLPCPDNGGPNPEGKQEPSCGVAYASVLGKFPWITLETGVLRDGSNECLWYAVSGHYKIQSGVETMTNEDSPAQLRLYASDGLTLLRPNPDDDPDERLIAAIFSPGPALPGQDRNSVPAAEECGGNYNPGDYLEGNGGASNSSLSGLSTSLDNILQGDDLSKDTVNDRVITISKAEVWAAIKNRRFTNIDKGSPSIGVPTPSIVTYEQIFRQFTHELAQCIADYGNADHGGVVNPYDLRLPWAVPVDAISDAGNYYYAKSDNYDDQATTYGGRFPYIVDDSVASVENIFVEGNCVAFLSGHATYPMYQNLWEHWKDHVFYAVSQDFAPNLVLPGGAPIACNGNCLSVNGIGQYAAVVIFGGSPNVGAGQKRDGPPGLPATTDEKKDLGNYLHPSNEDGIDNPLTNKNFISGLPNLNDIIMCVTVDPMNSGQLIVDVDCIP